MNSISDIETRPSGDLDFEKSMKTLSFCEKK